MTQVLSRSADAVYDFGWVSSCVPTLSNRQLTVKFTRWLARGPSRSLEAHFMAEAAAELATGLKQALAVPRRMHQRFRQSDSPLVAYPTTLTSALVQTAECRVLADRIMVDLGVTASTLRGVVHLAVSHDLARGLCEELDPTLATFNAA